MMVSRCDTLHMLNPLQLHSWRINDLPNMPDQRIRHVIIGGRRIMVFSRRRGESSPVLSVHQILIHVHRNLNAETVQAWEDLSNMLNDTPHVVAIEENNNLLRNCNIAFQTIILE